MTVVLAIETSCDETAAAVVDSSRSILSNVVWSQIEEHIKYGGVVPELSARSHVENLHLVVRAALIKAKLDFADIDAIAATGGPGLVGGLVVGVTTAKAMATALGKPFIAVNHLVGHALTIRLSHGIPYPFLLLLVSGGHCQIIIVSSPNNFAVLGGTIDDALGEAFDKVAKMLGFAYPGGPIIEKMAAMGDRNAFHFPRALTGQDNCNFSFSGLKTAVKRTIERIDNINDEVIANICASFQETVSEILQDKISNALVRFVEMYPDCNNVVLAGGVASNLYLRKKLQEVLNIFHMKLVAPPLPLCTDNAAMIAWAAIEKMSCGPVDDLMFDPRPCWPISDIV